MRNLLSSSKGLTNYKMITIEASASDTDHASVVVPTPSRGFKKGDYAVLQNDNSINLYTSDDTLLGSITLTISSGYMCSGWSVTIGGVTTSLVVGTEVVLNGDASFLLTVGELPDYLCFTANTAGSTVQLTKTGTPTSITLETSTDGNTWSAYTIGDTITLTNIGDKVYWRNTSTNTTGFSTSSSNYYQFVMTGSIAGSGDINYLINKNSTTIVSYCCYMYLFKSCTSLTTAPKLPATTLASYCYGNMFQGCTGLTTPPAILPATTLTSYCYQSMFDGCTALTTTPELPATTVSYSSYTWMFGNCKNLTTAPALPATTLATGCYYAMFFGCSKLTAIPALPATTLADSCYSCMFLGCGLVKLSETQTGAYVNEYRIPTTGTGTNANNSTYQMLVNTSGTFKGDPVINTTYYTSNTVVPAS